MTDIEFIASKLSREDILCQLAEKASEFAQAALKLRRAITGTNPTPVSENDAKHALNEEIVDVAVAVEAWFKSEIIGIDEIGTDDIESALGTFANIKIARWAQRLKDAANTNREPVTSTIAPTDTPTEHAWISVEDRLPEDARQRVLVKLGKSNHDIGDPKVDTDRYTVGCTGNLCWARWGKLVTHWMSLPESAMEDSHE